MSHTYMLLTALAMMVLVAVLAPNILAFNRGRILRNIAIWLAIFVALGLVYQTFGPGGTHPLFAAPDNLSGMRMAPAENSTPDSAKKDDDAQEYTPPKE